MKNLPEFMKVYTEELQRIVEEYPDEYPWGGRTPVAHVAARMKDAMIVGSYNKDGRAFKATCKRLGIKYTYKAIREFCKGEESEDHCSN